ncbi:PAAR domain-containing protein [Aquimarina longa]|uniref:PAAR domain-containing protein n=1 Tax=Aquimarina longa TaxID=1080221 RepID=UPI0009E6BD43
MPGQAATVGSMHTCPMCSGTVPHVGGPITGPGAPNILHNNKPAAVQGDMCTCIGPPDMIAQGHPAIFHNGKPAVSVGDMTAHGGIISQGEPNIIYGFVSEPMTPVTLSVNRIPFPEISIINRVLGNTKEAEANQNALREQQEEEPRIYNLQWVKEEKITRKSSVITQVTLRADVINFDDGETVTFTLNLPPQEQGGNPRTVSLSGTVQDKQVEVVWETEDTSQQNQCS